MRKVSLVIATSVFVLALGVMSSCKKNTETPAKPKLSFSETTKSVSEADGTIDIVMELDKPAPEAISVTYELSGTAIDQVVNANTADYAVTSTYLECKIKKGETTGTITLEVYSDFNFEDDETIDIAIKDTDSENIEITRDDDIKITLTQEDGLGVFLAWGVGDGEDYTNVDMDLFLWAEDNTSTLQLTNVASADASFNSPEFIFLPTALLDDGDYGLSCNYYEGTEDPMNFVVSFIPYINGTAGTAVEIEGSYSLDNRNPWVTSEVDPLLVQTFKKAGTSFSDFSAIDVPETGSRIGSVGKLPHSLREKSMGAQRNMILRKFKR